MIRKCVPDSCGEILIKSEAEEHNPKVFYCIWRTLSELTEQLLHVNCAGNTKGSHIINSGRDKVQWSGQYSYSDKQGSISLSAVFSATNKTTHKEYKMLNMYWKNVKNICFKHIFKWF